MGVVCKLVQFVVYFVLFVMMSTNIEKNSAVSAVSEEGNALTAYSKLKPLFQTDKTPDLRCFDTVFQRPY